MTQYPFEREFSKKEVAQLNTEQAKTDSQKVFELSDEDLDGIAGGCHHHKGGHYGKGFNANHGLK
ncbi:MAG: hypothetical protein ACRC2R_12725 [Xenococcaceae cyanobacterium]